MDHWCLSLNKTKQKRKKKEEGRRKNKKEKGKRKKEERREKKEERRKKKEERKKEEERRKKKEECIQTSSFTTLDRTSNVRVFTWLAERPKCWVLPGL